MTKRNLELEGKCSELEFTLKEIEAKGTGAKEQPACGRCPTLEKQVAVRNAELGVAAKEQSKLQERIQTMDREHTQLVSDLRKKLEASEKALKD